MQDRYAGDVGDFSKYAVLREIVNATGWNCGIVWYRFPNESHNSDGRHVDYFSKREFSGCDDELLSKLEIVASGTSRSVANLEAANLLPPRSKHFSEELPTSGGLRARHRWFERAMDAVSGCDLVMCDPDNGIAPPGVKPGSIRLGKYITPDEISQLAQRAKCLVIYHHFDRSMSHTAQMDRHLTNLSSASSDGATPFALRYRRISPRAYFVLPSEASEELSLACQRLCSPPWNKHFEIHSLQVG